MRADGGSREDVGSVAVPIPGADGQGAGMRSAAFDATRGAGCGRSESFMADGGAGHDEAVVVAIPEEGSVWP